MSGLVPSNGVISGAGNHHALRSELLLIDSLYLQIFLASQIEPREVEIGEMRETIRAMDAELERYHKSNAGLDLTIQVQQQHRSAGYSVVHDSTFYVWTAWALLL